MLPLCGELLTEESMKPPKLNFVSFVFHLLRWWFNIILHTKEYDNTCKNKDLQSISKNVYNSSPYNPYILMGHPNAQFWNYKIYDWIID